MEEMRLSYAGIEPEDHREVTDYRIENGNTSLIIMCMCVCALFFEVKTSFSNLIEYFSFMKSRHWICS